jgi:hypothetical protein
VPDKGLSSALPFDERGAGVAPGSAKSEICTCREAAVCRQTAPVHMLAGTWAVPDDYADRKRLTGRISLRVAAFAAASSADVR